MSNASNACLDEYYVIIFEVYSYLLQYRKSFLQFNFQDLTSDAMIDLLDLWLGFLEA